MTPLRATIAYQSVITDHRYPLRLARAGVRGEHCDGESRAVGSGISRSKRLRVNWDARPGMMGQHARGIAGTPVVIPDLLVAGFSPAVALCCAAVFAPK